MNIAVVVPTVRRHDALRRVAVALEGQTVAPTVVMVSASAPGAVPDDVRALSRVRVVESGKGASRQRNVGVAALSSDTDVVVFLDDDSVPREDYLASVCQAFAEMPDVVAITGRMACDGAAEKREVPPDELHEALTRSHGADDPTRTEPCRELYGCNMAVRYADAVATPFDEALPLYSWLEDLDLARRLARRGRIVRDSRCVVAHQGSASGGRTQHVRFGYSSVMNAVHLARKGSIAWVELVSLVGRPAAGNVRGLLRRSSRASAGLRLVGQAHAVADLARGRITPGRIECM